MPNDTISTMLSEITNRTNKKRMEIMKNEMCILDKDMTQMEKKIENIENVYSKLLMKDKPSGSSLKAIRHLR